MNFMSAKPLQFVDTNVLIYAHDRSAGPKHEQARALMAELWEHRAGCLSIQVLQEFYVNITRKVTHPLSPETAVEIINDLATWQIHQPDVSDLLAAIRLQTRLQLSFWDAMIIASANRLGCHTVWSEDLNAGQTYGDTVVQNPFS